MKNITTIFRLSFLTLLLTAFGVTTYGQYCSSNATSTADTKCDEVILDGNSTSINNNTATGGCATYTNFTSLPAPELTAGSQYNLSVKQGTCGGNYTRRVQAWIDYNQDEIFQNSEALRPTVTASGTGGLVISIDFTVPCGITSGNTRMRVVVKEGGGMSPCGTYTWGETEDYTVNLVTPSSSVTANFFAPDTAYIGTAVTFVNPNTAPIYSEWDLGND
jgi:hypothetical protein